MKKTVSKVLILAGMVFIMGFLFFGCKNVPITTLQSLNFNYTTGTALYQRVNYEVKLEDGVYTVGRLLPDEADEDVKTAVLPEERVRELEQLFRDNKVGRWDDFHGSNKHVMDGNSFSISIHMTDDGIISAHGYVSYPPHYREVRDGIERILNTAFPEESAD